MQVWINVKQIKRWPLAQPLVPSLNNKIMEAVLLNLPTHYIVDGSEQPRIGFNIFHCFSSCAGSRKDNTSHFWAVSIGLRK